ncbi:MAG: hypothetical protein ISR74_06320 [Candidatus Thioglobus sp.]|nr:hypothetical protein [Candidatus Thioglobus pontius]MBL6985193.1 hypothetical protein [Candidatus Thioglobus sp.]
MFEQALNHWEEDDFFQYFQQAFAQLNLDELPLFTCCKYSGVIDPDSISLRLLSSRSDAQTIHLKIGVFFCEILSGCACSDDPSLAIMLENNYCELTVEINRADAKTTFASCAF